MDVGNRDLLHIIGLHLRQLYLVLLRPHGPNRPDFLRLSVPDRDNLTPIPIPLFRPPSPHNLHTDPLSDHPSDYIFRAHTPQWRLDYAFFRMYLVPLNSEKCPITEQRDTTTATCAILAVKCQLGSPVHQVQRNQYLSTQSPRHFHCILRKSQSFSTDLPLLAKEMVATSFLPHNLSVVPASSKIICLRADHKNRQQRWCVFDMSGDFEGPCRKQRGAIGRQSTLPRRRQHVLPDAVQPQIPPPLSVGLAGA